MNIQCHFTQLCIVSPFVYKHWSGPLLPGCARRNVSTPPTFNWLSRKFVYGKDCRKPRVIGGSTWQDKSIDILILLVNLISSVESWLLYFCPGFLCHRGNLKLNLMLVLDVIFWGFPTSVIFWQHPISEVVRNVILNLNRPARQYWDYHTLDASKRSVIRSRE